MSPVLSFSRRALTIVALFALLLAGVVPAWPAQAATPKAAKLDAACKGTKGARFSDAKDTTFEFEIYCFAHRGFTRGAGSASTYKPLARNTRWQMAAFIYRVLQAVHEANEEFELPQPEDQGFTDIGSLDQESQDAINVLAALDIVEGTTETRFEPMSTVRRDQTASFINRAQGAIQAQVGGDPNGFAADENFFPDAEGVYRANINGVASVGIAQGRLDGRYHRADPVLRGQMAAFIVRWVQVLHKHGLFGDTNGAGGGGVAANVVDTDVDGALTVGDVVVLRPTVELSELAGDGADDTLTLLDSDGTLVTLDCGNNRCLQGDGSLLGERILGDDGVHYVRVAGDNLVRIEAGDVEGLDLDARIVELSDGFVSADGGRLRLGKHGCPLELVGTR